MMKMPGSYTTGWRRSVRVARMKRTPSRIDGWMPSPFASCPSSSTRRPMAGQYTKLRRAAGLGKAFARFGIEESGPADDIKLRERNNDDSTETRFTGFARLGRRPRLHGDER